MEFNVVKEPLKPFVLSEAYVKLIKRLQGFIKVAVGPFNVKPTEKVDVKGVQRRTNRGFTVCHSEKSNPKLVNV